MIRKLVPPDLSRRSFLQAGAGLSALGLLGCAGGGTGQPSGVDRSASDDSGSSDPTTTTTADGEIVATTTTAPELQPSEYVWTGARTLFVTVPVTPVAGAPWLPPGLDLIEPATATFFVARYPMTAFGSVYNEAAVLLHIHHDEGLAVHCPWMVVDDDTALVYGRELLGFPKKMAEIELTEADGRIVGTVSRAGTELIRVEAESTQFEAEDAAVWGARHIVNVHGSVVGGMRLLDLAPLDEEVLERSVGRATLTVGRTDRDPIGDLEPGGEGEAVFAVTDFGKLTSPFTLAEEQLPFDWTYQMSLYSPRVQ